MSDEDIARVYAPCGLDIGSSTVEETAVAILAEIIARRTGREGRPLRQGEGPIRRDREESSALLRAAGSGARRRGLSGSGQGRVADAPDVGLHRRPRGLGLARPRWPRRSRQCSASVSSRMPGSRAV